MRLADRPSVGAELLRIKRENPDAVLCIHHVGTWALWEFRTADGHVHVVMFEMDLFGVFKLCV